MKVKVFNTVTFRIDVGCVGSWSILFTTSSLQLAAIKFRGLLAARHGELATPRPDGQRVLLRLRAHGALHDDGVWVTLISAFYDCALEELAIV